VGSSYRDAVAFGVLFLVLVLRPRGLLGAAALREA
jgi:branched-chain amino acid transport system permease protein